MQHGGIVGFLFPLIALGGPLLLGLAGLWWGRASGAAAPAASTVERWDWRLTCQSAILYAFAFNLVFFIQELFLVLPKALVPGLRPTLFHNNHTWQGDNPLAALFQGTGALAIFVTGLGFALSLRRRTGRSTALRLFLIWMAFQGLFESLPQLVVGAVSPSNDVGMAMNYLGMSAAAKALAALLALAAMAAAGLSLTRPLLGLASTESEIASAGRRTRFIFRIAILPALIAIPAIIAFRVPRELAEVILPPIAVTVLGMAWIQANAWRVADAKPGGFSAARPFLPQLAALLILLLIFQLILRPGIHFY
jgi:hypothetical protein